MLDFNTRSEITGYTLEDHIASAATNFRGFMSRHSLETLDRELNATADTIAGYFNANGDEIYHEIARRVSFAIFRPDIEI